MQSRLENQLVSELIETSPDLSPWSQSWPPSEVEPLSIPQGFVKAVPGVTFFHTQRSEQGGFAPLGW